MHSLLKSIPAVPFALVLWAGPLFSAPRSAPAPPQGRGQSDVEIVVVGAGISGLAAALEAGKSGARVTVLDMWSIFGGHAVVAGGVLSIVDSPAQRAQGIQDSPDLAFRDFMRWGEDPNPEWVRYYVEHSREEIYDWLSAMGVEFGSIGRNPGNTVPRVHRTQGGGLALVMALYRECLKYPGISFLWNHQVRSLKTREARVVGLEAENLRTGQSRELSASAVILATGGFQSNLQMVQEFWPEQIRFPEQLFTASGINAVGLGHALAEEAGGAVTYMDHQWNYSTGIPDPRYPGTRRGLFSRTTDAIWVNVDGERFVNESSSHKFSLPAVTRQKTSSFWAVFDEAGRESFAIRGTTAWEDPQKIIFEDYSHIVRQADSLEGLALLTGLPPKALTGTVARYNGMVEQGKDEDFGRFEAGRTPSEELVLEPYTPRKIQTPPFYAIRTYPITRKSLGGVRIDSQARVLLRSGAPIPALYAVGEVTGFGQLNGKAGLEGTFLGPSIVTGRVGARTALAELRSRVSADLPAASVRESGKAPAGPVENLACLKCHDLPALVGRNRPGYQHFEFAHQVVLRRGDRCMECHAEFSAVPGTGHRFDRRAQVDNCTKCH